MLNETILTNKPLQLSILAIVIIVVIYFAATFFNRTYIKQSRFRSWSIFFDKVALKPFLLLLCELITVLAWNYFKIRYQIDSEIEETIFTYFVNISELIVFYWLSINLINWTKEHVIDLAIRNKYSNLLIFIPSIASCFKGLAFLSMINILIPKLNLNDVLELIAEKITHILLILIISWVFYKLINSLEKYILNKYILENKDAGNTISNTRRVHTQVIILKKVLITLLLVVTFSAILMAFDSIRSVGQNILTTAGVISAIAAFASQQSLGRMFAGLQIAITQPVRIGDSVIIDNEFGEVQEITLSFITIKLWDLRTLILPTDHFINKGLLNLTRDSSELLGTVFLYTDYTLPVDRIRKTFLQMLEQMPLWNKKVAQLDVSDIKEHTLELRCLISADNAGDLWKLRCNVRESLMNFIVKNYPHCLSQQRNIAAIEKSIEKKVEVL